MTTETILDSDQLFLFFTVVKVYIFFPNAASLLERPAFLTNRFSYFQLKPDERYRQSSRFKMKPVLNFVNVLSLFWSRIYCKHLLYCFSYWFYQFDFDQRQLCWNISEIINRYEHWRFSALWNPKWIGNTCYLPLNVMDLNSLNLHKYFRSTRWFWKTNLWSFYCKIQN